MCAGRVARHPGPLLSLELAAFLPHVVPSGRRVSIADEARQPAMDGVEIHGTSAVLCVGLTANEMLYRSVFWFLWETVGSAALGYLVGLLLATWSSHVTESGEMLILLAGSILFCVGFSRALSLLPLVTSLAVGATMVNLAGRVPGGVHISLSSN